MKLKKLILCGFKSFADRTEFHFADGVSCIVGPNGCGKSNVVDAMKWVLGEQSAKSLRGSEMMDVIFNGSSARRASGSAEVTLVFDNSDGLLQVPGDGEGDICETVSVTRRLFRSGQSGYLINKKPSRLKDIREMFMDTGMGRDAYSVIEQGRVELFLQASQDDRRSIFDEAAGISKYKARKKEALRKLERVEQDLLRVNDVLAEIEKRLRSIKYQAGKARNYQNYSEQLSELRSQFFLAQYHTYNTQRTELRQTLDAGNDQMSSIHVMIEQLELAHNATEAEAADLERTAREMQGQIAAMGAQITAGEQREAMLAQKASELKERVVLVASRCEELETKTQAVVAEALQRQGEFEQLETEAVAHRERYEEAREEHTAGEMETAHLRAQLEEDKAAAIDIMRQVAQHNNVIQGNQIRQENLHAQGERLSTRSEEVGESLRTRLAEHAEMAEAFAQAKELVDATQSRLDQTRANTQELSDSEFELRTEMAQSREKHSAVDSRMAALSEMQARLEGVAAGVRKVLKARDEGKLDAIRGMLGDFLETEVAKAPIVEAALAGADQRLVIESMELFGQTEAELRDVLGENGTAEIICIDRAARSIDPTQDVCGGGEQVIARVIDWVSYDQWLSPAMESILGRTFVVQDIRAAVYAADAMDRGCRFVTMTGEVLEADGRVRLSAAKQGAGIITRRSELAELATQSAALAERIGELEGQCRTTREEIKNLENIQQQLRATVYEANTKRVECESRLTQLGEQVERLEQESPVIAEDLRNIAEEIETAARAEQEAGEKVSQLEQLSVQNEQRVAGLEEMIGASAGRQSELAERLTELKVTMASAEQKKLSLRDTVASLNRQKSQMTQDLENGRGEIELNRQRATDAEDGIESARQETEAIGVRRQALQVDSVDVEETRSGLHERLGAIRDQLASQRKTQEESTESVNSLRVKLGQIDTNVENLIARARDEMDMDITQCLNNYEHDAQRDWDAVRTQIDDLQQKIKRLGNVNLDAIGEQEELEQRQEFLSKQLGDVAEGRSQLEELIQKINKESRDLFLDTFTAVRGHFQELFRKLFGGGRADIILTDPEDVLESGIEIVARPPGKELRNLTLLSGGEKTMTALALLFSIFKAKPSPFCLLDEVDAALDEANTERFSRLFDEFAGTSQFVVISHAKRTMAQANVLYGVTMQEPGVSKRISVKFEDTGNKLDRQLEPVVA